MPVTITTRVESGFRLKEEIYIKVIEEAKKI